MMHGIIIIKKAPKQISFLYNIIVLSYRVTTSAMQSKHPARTHIIILLCIHARSSATNRAGESGTAEREATFLATW